MNRVAFPLTRVAAHTQAERFAMRIHVEPADVVVDAQARERLLVERLRRTAAVIRDDEGTLRQRRARGRRLRPRDAREVSSGRQQARADDQGPGRHSHGHPIRPLPSTAPTNVGYGLSQIADSLQLHVVSNNNLQEQSVEYQHA